MAVRCGRSRFVAARATRRRSRRTRWSAPSVSSTGRRCRTSQGVGTFAGPAFHSAEWDHSVDLTGKRVAVIGTGSSASQFIPIVAEQAGQLTIFQRTPNWYSAIPNYHEAVPDGLQWLFRHVPTYAQWYRFWLFWVSSDGLLPMARVEEGWEPLDRSVGADNDHLRELFTRSMTKQLEERPDLLAKVMPDYPPASKRIVVDNGVWPATLKRENVGLVTRADPRDHGGGHPHRGRRGARF